MPHVPLRSLLLVEERLLEADHFLKRLRHQSRLSRFGYELNAFLSACRSVTFLLQKEMSEVPGFDDWWKRQQRRLKADSAATFFVDLRNFSVHEGRISLVGYARRQNGKLRWSYRFAGSKDPVPAGLLHRDVTECCEEHLAKLATVALDCAEKFPFATCPQKATTLPGIRSLGITVEDIEETLGFQRGWTAIDASTSDDLRLRELRRHVDGVDFRALKRLSSIGAVYPKILPDAESPGDVFGDLLITSIVEEIETKAISRR